jgi:very-short-patch-repair endonuclease
MTRIAPQTRANARKLRAEMTRQERLIWPRLRELNTMAGTHFRRQAPIGPYIADFADLGLRLVIEADGGGHGRVRDERRDLWLNGQGFTVLRFWNPEIERNLDGVMQLVLDAVMPLTEAPPPHPSPTRGEGGAEPAALCRASDPKASPPPRGEGMGVGGQQRAARAQKGQP